MRGEREQAARAHLSSYTHTGRYYTLASVPEFAADGLWRREQVGFSRDGTLKATVQRMVETSEAGHTQHELQRRLSVSVRAGVRVPPLALTAPRRS